MSKLPDLMRPLLRAGEAQLFVIQQTDDWHLVDGQTAVWVRFAQQGIEFKPAALPPAGAFQQIILPQPRGKQDLEFCVAALLPVLAAAGEILVYGLNALGVKSANQNLLKFFTDVTCVAQGGHGRVWRCTHPHNHAPITENFATQLALNGGSLKSYSNLFAKGQLDSATELLIAALPPTMQGAVMDFACGIGVLGAAAAQRGANAVSLVDYNALAVQVAQQNLQQFSVKLTTHCAASPSAVTGMFDYVISNPPIHVGGQLNFSIVADLLANLLRLLLPTGQAFIVVQVTVPIAAMVAEVNLASAKKLAAAVVAAANGFNVWRLTLV